jgi:hypothetical protein
VNETEILEALERVVPRYDDRSGDWDAVAGELRRRGTLRVATRVAALAVAALVVAAAVLLWPASSHNGGVLERALAAVGKGPVLHIVLREGFGQYYTVVDLETGNRTPLDAVREVWYDPSRGLHTIDRLGGVVQSDDLYFGAEAHDQLVSLGGAVGEYKDALESGTAKLGGTGEVDGIPVYWIKLNVQMLPQSDGKDHEFADQVAVSRETYEPIATRTTLDGVTSPDGITRILRLETASAGSGNFARLTPSLDGEVMSLGRVGELTTAQASAVLGRPALWVGQDFDGIPLTRIAKLEASHGYPPGAGWQHTKTGVTFVYGDESEASRKPYVHLWEATTIVQDFLRGRYVPPEGSLLLFGKSSGLMQKDGIYLSIVGSSEDVILAAARALRPVGAR